MVSALATTRLIASQMALQLLQPSNPSQDSDNSPLLGNSSGDPSNLPSQSQASLSALLNSLTAKQSDDSTASQADDSSTDITSSSFMDLLKQNLQDAVKAEGPDGQAQAMLDALNNGTLTVSNPPAGVSITAWDVDSADEKDTTSKTGTSIDTSDWNTFLKAHLQRGSNGAFVRNDDGSFVDKTTGNEAYFGQVGSQFYYLTWPSPSAAGSDGATADAPAAADKTGA